MRRNLYITMSLLICLILSLQTSDSYASNLNEDLFIYGRTTCGATQHYMRELDKANIKYIFKSIDDPNDRPEYIKKVRAAGMTGTIYLPVISYKGVTSSRPDINQLISSASKDTPKDKPGAATKDELISNTQQHAALNQASSNAGRSWDIAGISLGLQSTAVEKIIASIAEKRKPKNSRDLGAIFGAYDPETKRVQFKLPGGKASQPFDLYTKWSCGGSSIRTSYSLNNPGETIAIYRNEDFRREEQVKPKVNEIKNSFIEKFGPIDYEEKVNETIVYFWFCGVDESIVNKIKSNKIDYGSQINTALSYASNLDRVLISKGIIASASITTYGLLHETDSIQEYDYSIIDFSKLTASVDYLVNITNELQRENQNREAEKTKDRTKL